MPFFTVRAAQCLASLFLGMHTISGCRIFLSELELRRSRIAELEKELQSVMAEKKTRQEQGKSVDELDIRLEELERRKHSLVEQLQDRWSA